MPLSVFTATLLPDTSGIQVPPLLQLPPVAADVSVNHKEACVFVFVADLRCEDA